MKRLRITKVLLAALLCLAWDSCLPEFDGNPFLGSWSQQVEEFKGLKDPVVEVVWTFTDDMTLSRTINQDYIAENHHYDTTFVCKYIYNEQYFAYGFSEDYAVDLSSYLMPKFSYQFKGKKLTLSPADGNISDPIVLLRKEGNK